MPRWDTEAREEMIRHLQSRERQHSEEPGLGGSDRSWWRCMPLSDVDLWWRVYVEPRPAIEREAAVSAEAETEPPPGITHQAVELMKSGCPEEAAFYWATIIVKLRERAQGEPPPQALDVVEAARAWLKRTDELNDIAGDGLVVDPRYLPAARAELAAAEEFRAALKRLDEASS